MAGDSDRGTRPFFVPAKTALNFLFFFLVIFSYYIAKPIRNSLFLEWMGPQNLPFVYLLSAMVTLAGAFALDLLLKRIPPLRLVPGGLCFFSLSLFLFWWLFKVYEKLGPALSFVLYLFVSFFAVVAVTLFWAACNDTHTEAEGKSSYHLIGLGGIVGGLAGSQATEFLAVRLGTENLLLVSAFILLLAVPLPVLLIRNYSRVTGLDPSVPVTKAATDGSIGTAKLGSVLRMRYVLAIAAFVFMGTVCGSLLDFQFQGIIKSAGLAKDVRTAFFGSMFKWVGMGGILLHLLVTRPALAFAGPISGLLPLPIIAFAGAIALFLNPNLSMVMIVGVSYGAFGYSMAQVTRETLYLRVPREIKYRAKFYIDTFVFRFGDAFAALVLLFSTRVLMVSRPVLYSQKLLLAVIWAVLVIVFVVKAGLLPTKKAPKQ